MKHGKINLKSVTPSLNQLAGFDDAGNFKALDASESTLASTSSENVFSQDLFASNVKKYLGTADVDVRGSYYYLAYNSYGNTRSSTQTMTQALFEWSEEDAIPSTNGYNWGDDDAVGHRFIADMGSEVMINYIKMKVLGTGTTASIRFKSSRPFYLYGLKDGYTPTNFQFIDDPSYYHLLFTAIPNVEFSENSLHESVINTGGEAYRYYVAVIGKFWDMGINLINVGQKQGLDYATLPASEVSNEISFSNKTVFNSYDSPATGNITHNLTNAKFGLTQKIYHNDSVSPTFPSEWVKIGSGSYQINTLNIIEAEYVDSTRIEYRILQ